MSLSVFDFEEVEKEATKNNIYTSMNGHYMPFRWFHKHQNPFEWLTYDIRILYL